MEDKVIRIKPKEGSEVNQEMLEKLQSIPDGEIPILSDDTAKDIMDNIMNSFEMPTLVNPSVSLINEPNPYKRIEIAGRTCYKSESNITKDSSIKFVNNMLKNQHMAMIEHAVVVFVIDCHDGSETELMDFIQYIKKQDYMHITFEPDIPRIMVSGNVRAILERKVVDPIYNSLVSKYPEFKNYHFEGDDPMYYHITATVVDIKRIKDLTHDEFLEHFNLTCKFVTDRGVTHEIVRHRPFSFAQESTRYCNYSKDKFGGHVTFCKPTTFNSWSQDVKDTFLSTLSVIDTVYNYITNTDNALTAQLARAVLPQCTKAEIVVTGPAYEWIHFFNLRSRGLTGAPHPDMKFVADKALLAMNKYIKGLKFQNELTV